MKKKLFSSVFLLVCFVFLVLNCLTSVDAQTDCNPSEPPIPGSDPPPGKCNQENNAKCCKQGDSYPNYTCSPAVSDQTKATLTLNSFEKDGDGGAASACDDQYHSNDELVVALSTGWFDNRSRCLKNINIIGNGNSVLAKVVDECDSTKGCDKEHAYLVPCENNIVDASKSVWQKLDVDEGSDDWGRMEISWSDAP